MAKKKPRKAVKRTVRKASGGKRSKKTLKRTFKNLNMKYTLQSPSWSPTNSLKSRKARDAVTSNYALRSSGRLKKLKLPRRSSSKRSEARSQKNSRRVLHSTTTSSRTFPKRRYRQKTVSVSSGELKQRTKESSQTPTLTEIEVESEEYEVEQICDIKFTDGQELYLVKWKGFASNENTWEPRENLENADGAINDFHEGYTYEVEFIYGTRVIGGQRQYRVRWKGWPPSGDTWEPRTSLMEGAKKEVIRFEKIGKRRTA